MKEITLFNENGTIKPKEQFLSEMESIYNNANSYTNDMFLSCTKLENTIDIDNMLATFNVRSRSINIFGDITPEMARYVIDMIRFINVIDFDTDEDPEPIHMYIDSAGGDLYATLSIIGAMNLSLTPIITYNVGKALSGGFFILISGNLRYAAPYASYLFHEGYTANGADAHKFFQEADYYKTQLKTLKKIVLENTKISEKLYDKKKKDDWWFDNETAIELGVIDKVMDSFIIPDFSILEKKENEEKGDECTNECSHKK